MKFCIVLFITILVTMTFGQKTLAAEYQFQSFSVNKKALENKYPGSASDDYRLQKRSPGKSFKTSAINKGLNAESPLMTEVREFLESNFQTIEDKQVDALFQRKKDFNLGVKNYNGFVWQKPLGNVHIVADRQIEPNMQEGPKYVVSDILTLRVNAQTYLKSLEGEGIISIDDAEFGAFAGLEFHRVYTYKHFSNTPDKAIEDNMKKLFLSFLFFETANMELVGAGEVLTKEDYIGFNAGAMATIPLQYNFSITAGVLIKADKTSKITATIPVEADMLNTNQFLRLNYEKSASFSAGAELKLKLDFFNVLKISLLKFEYSEKRTTTEELHLAYEIDDFYKFLSSNPVRKSLVKLLRFQGYESNNLNKYVQTYSLNKKLDKLWNFRFLNEGKASKTQSEQIVTQRKNIHRRFIGHNYSHLEFKQGWKDAAISLAIQSLLNTDMFSKYMKTHRKITDLNFESGDKEDFTLKITHEFMVAKTRHSKNKKYKEELIDFSFNFSNLSHDILYLVDHDRLQGPIKVKAVSEFGPSAFLHFHNLSKGDRKNIYTEICKPHKKRNRRPNNRGPRYTNLCTLSLSPLMKKFDDRSTNPDEQLWIFKDVVDKVNYYSTSVNDLISMFGPVETINTVIEAETDQGQKFKHYSNGPRKSKQSPVEYYLNNKLTLLPKLYFH